MNEPGDEKAMNVNRSPHHGIVRLCVKASLVLFASTHAITGVYVTQEASAQTNWPVVSVKPHEDAEPKLDIEFSSVMLDANGSEVDVGLSGPYSLSTTPAGTSPQELVVKFADQNGDIESAEAKYSGGLLKENQPAKADGVYTLALTLDDTISSDKRGVAVIKIDVTGRNGRTYSKSVRVFVNSGAFVGVMRPTPTVDVTGGTLNISADTFSFSTNKFEGSTLYIDKNASGGYDGGEPVTVVDANNEFHFPIEELFYFEQLIRPLSLVVDGGEPIVDAAEFRKFLVNEQHPWFKIEPIVEEVGDQEARAVGTDQPTPETLEEVSENPTERELNQGESEGRLDGPAEQAAADAVAEEAEAGSPPIFVNSRVETSGDGTSWDNAFKTLFEALKAPAVTAATPNNQVQIWVADGVYIPETATGFPIPANVSLYGGFAGDEDSRDARPRIKRGTILSGDIGNGDSGDDGHFAPVNAVAISPDGNLIATASEDRTVKIWKSKEKTLVATLDGNLQSVHSVCFAPALNDPLPDEGYRLVTGGKDMTVRLWGLDEAGVPLAAAPSRILSASEGDGYSHFGPVVSVAISPDGKRIASASEDGTIGMWDVADVQSPTLITKLPGHEGAVRCVAFVDNKTIASGGDDRTVRTWLDSDGSWREMGPLTGHTGAVTEVAVIHSGDTATFASAGGDSSIRIWKRYDLSNRRIQLIEVEDVSDVPSSGSNLAIAASVGEARDLVLRIFDQHGEVVFFEPFAKQDQSAIEVATMDLWGTGFLVGDARERVSDVVTALLPFQEGLVPPINNVFGPVTGLAASPNRRALVSSHEATSEPNEGNRICLWNVETGQLTTAMKVEDPSISGLAAAAPGGPEDEHNYWIVAGRANHTSTIWNITPLPANSEYAGQTSVAAISHDGVLAATVEGNTVKLRTIGSNDPPKALVHDDASSVDSLCFSRGVSPTAHIATASSKASEKKLIWWTIADLNAITSATRQVDHSTTCIASSSDDTMLATGGSDKVVRVWNVADLDNLAVSPITFGGHLQKITSVIIVGEGEKTRVVSASEDGTIKIWDVKGEELETTIDAGVAVADITVKNSEAELLLIVAATKPADSFENVRLRSSENLSRHGVADVIVDGVQVELGNHVLVNGQDDAKENGIYVVADEDWVPTLDANEGPEFQVGKHVLVKEGRAFAGRYAKYVGQANAVPGTNEIHFADSNGTVAAWSWDRSLSTLRGLDPIQAYFVNSLEFASDGNMLVTGDQNDAVTVWSRDDNQVFQRIDSIPHEVPVNTVSIASTDSTMTQILSSSGNTVRVWEQHPIGDPTSTAAFGLANDVDDNAASVLVIADGAQNVVLDGLVIKGGFSTVSDGGGIRCAGTVGNKIEVANCFLEGNRASNGGAIVIGKSIANTDQFVIRDSSFSQNQAVASGGAVFASIDFSSLTFESCVFNTNSANSPTSMGGAVAAAQGGNVTFEHCTIHNCNAQDAHAIMSVAPLTLNSSIIANNGNGSQDTFAIRLILENPQVTLTNCIVASCNTSNDIFGEVNTSSSHNLFGKKDGISNQSVIFIPPPDTDGDDTPDDSPDEIASNWTAYKNSNYVYSSGTDPLAFHDLFEAFGDYGGRHETLALSSDSFAREIGRDDDTIEWDQRGKHYTRRYLSPDIGAFELQPLPASNPDTYEFHNSNTDFISLGDPLANDGLPRINSALSIPTDALANENPTIRFQQVRLVATEEIAVPLAGPKTIDGMATAKGDRVLLVRQDGDDESRENGIYIVNHDGSWLPAGDANESSEMLKYKTVFVASGQQNANTTWTLTHEAEGGIPVFGTTPLRFEKSWTPTAFGQTKLDNDQLHYKLKAEFNNTGFLGRDEINCVGRFGDLISPPARATVWIVGPSEEVEALGVHRFVVDTALDHEIPDTGPIDFNKGKLTLREAMLLASSTEGDDLIEFDNNVFHDDSSVIHLFGPLDFPSNAKGSLVIQGPGIDRLSIDGGGSHRGLEISARKEHVERFEVSGLIFRNCRSSADGAAILIGGDTDVEIKRVGFVGNVAQISGGAIDASNNNATLTNCTFVENQSQGVDTTKVAVVSPRNVSVSDSVFFRNHFAAGQGLDETKYTGRNFYSDPRFVKQPQVIDVDPAAFGNIKLRRDSLAYEQSAPEDMNTFRFLGAYPKFPNGLADPFGAAGEEAQNTLYVDSSERYADNSVRIPGNGGSWKSALSSLNDAIEVASAEYRVTTIKIAGEHSPKREYKLPDEPNTASSDWTFILQHGLALEGGYRSAAALGSAANDDRDEALPSDPASDPTKLSGKLTPEIDSSNVLTAHGVRGFRVSRLTVTGGNTVDKKGGGLVVRAESEIAQTDPVGKVRGVLFERNDAAQGGAIYLEAGVLEVEQATFLGNRAADGGGGAIYIAHERSKLRASNSTFVHNAADTGGAIFAEKGSVSLDHLTIVRNAANASDGIGGLFVDPAIAAEVTNTIVCENIATDGQRGNTNHTPVGSNKFDLTWANENSLLALMKSNEFQTADGGLRNGPTETIAILPQIPFRIDHGNETLVEASAPRTESQTDQRGAPGASLARSDVGAFERQYFVHGDSATRFFVVDDDYTGRQLWAEVVSGQDGDATTTYVQVSQHIGKNPKIQTTLDGSEFAVQARAIEFETDSNSRLATQHNDGLVQPSTLFPHKKRSIGHLTLKATSNITLELTENLITLVPPDRLVAPTWSGTGVVGDKIANPQANEFYQIELQDNGITIESFQFRVSETDQ